MLGKSTHLETQLNTVKVLLTNRKRSIGLCQAASFHFENARAEIKSERKILALQIQKNKTHNDSTWRKKLSSSPFCVPRSQVEKSRLSSPQLPRVGTICHSVVPSRIVEELNALRLEKRILTNQLQRLKGLCDAEAD